MTNAVRCPGVRLRIPPSTAVEMQSICLHSASTLSSCRSYWPEGRARFLKRDASNFVWDIDGLVRSAYTPRRRNTNADFEDNTRRAFRHLTNWPRLGCQNAWDGQARPA